MVALEEEGARGNSSSSSSKYGRGQFEAEKAEERERAREILFQKKKKVCIFFPPRMVRRL